MSGLYLSMQDDMLQVQPNKDLPLWPRRIRTSPLREPLVRCRYCDHLDLYRGSLRIRGRSLRLEWRLPKELSRLAARNQSLSTPKRQGRLG